MTDPFFVPVFFELLFNTPAICFNQSEAYFLPCCVNEILFARFF